MNKIIKIDSGSEIILKKEVKKNATVIDCFPTIGFVGTIAGRYLAEELNMELIGYIESDKIPSVAIVHESKPCPPIRIYTKNNLILILSELVIPFQFTHELSNVLIKWFKEINPKEAISLVGLSSEPMPLRIIKPLPVQEEYEKHVVFGIATNNELNRKLEKLNVTVINEGTITGASSDILLKCLEHEIPAISLMVEAQIVPDPLASAAILKVLDKYLNLNIDIQKLVEQGKKVEKQFKVIFEQLKKGKTEYTKMEGFSPMYG